MSRSRARARARPRTFGIALVLALSTIAPAAAAAGASSDAKGADAASAATTAPAMGRYAATLCVANAAQPPSCGPAEAVVRRGAVDVRVSDIVYRLATSGSAAIVVVTQGQMMIDAFDTGPQWSGHSLSFVDAEKQVRYQLELGTRRAERR